MSQYEYDALDLTDMSKEAERLSKKAGDSNVLDNFVKMPEGEGHVLLRILPRLKGKQLWCGTRTHKLGVYPNERSFHCPRELRDTPNGQFWIAVGEDEGGHGDCPICKYYKTHWQRSLQMPKDSPEQKRLQEYLRKMKPVERYYYNVIVRECLNPKTKKIEKNVGPLILSVGKMVHGKIVGGIFGNLKTGKRGFGDVSNPLNGRDFNLVKNIKGDFPDYADSSFEEPSPAGEPEEWEKWMANRHDIFSLRKLLPFADLERVLMIHTGKIKDTNKEGFDTSKYDPEEPQYGGDEDVRQEMTQTTKPVVKQERKPETSAPKEAENVMTDPAFMAELDGITVDDE